MSKADYYIRRFRDGILTEREALEKEGISKLSPQERARYYDFISIRDKINKLSNVVFEVDHANTIHEHGINAITPDNLQLLTKEDNKLHGSKSHPRMTIKEQWRYLTGKIGFSGFSEEYELFYYLYSKLVCAYTHHDITNTAISTENVYHPKSATSNAEKRLYALLEAKNSELTLKEKTLILIIISFCRDAYDQLPETYISSVSDVIQGADISSTPVIMFTCLIDHCDQIIFGFCDFREEVMKSYAIELGEFLMCNKTSNSELKWSSKTIHLYRCLN